MLAIGNKLTLPRIEREARQLVFSIVLGGQIVEDILLSHGPVVLRELLYCVQCY